MNESDWKCRTELLIGQKNLDRLQNAHILIAGLGGVGGYAAEQLCRAGIGKITIADNDTIQTSNRNRQIIALESTEGLYKTDEFVKRLKNINPYVELTIVREFLNEGNIPQILEPGYDYIVDAIDTLTPKVTLLAESVRKGLKIVSSMGSGGKTDPTKIQVADLSKSNHCKFAYMVRKYLHRLGVEKGITVVFSTESVPRDCIVVTDGSGNKRSVIGTISYMPAIFGCFCAAEVIKNLIQVK
jgi:tRNA A37 threonylcarbamoyladenosine dehydratase